MNKRFSAKDRPYVPVEAGHVGDGELDRTMRLVGIDDPAVLSPEQLAAKYPVSYNIPEVDHKFVAHLADNENADQMVETHARSEIQKHNPVDLEQIDQRAGDLTGQITLFEGINERIARISRKRPSFEEVAVDEAKYSNAHKSILDLVSSTVLITGGMLVMGVTISNIILQGDRIPLAYDYPVIAYVFAFIPISIMFVLAQAYLWIDSNRGKNNYIALIFVLAIITSIVWLVTFSPAYSADVLDDDLSAPPGFDIFSLHISIQLWGEILLGALIKIAMFRKDRDYRKTEIRETADSKRTRASIAQNNILIKPLAAELEAISRHRTAYIGTMNSFVSAYKAALTAKKLELSRSREAGELAAAQVKLSHQFPKS